jgi:ribosomal protein L11
MTTKISNELLKRINEATIAEPQREIPVIVTVTPGTDLDELEEKGLKVQRTFQNSSDIAGTLTVAEVNPVAALDSVVAIDYDGTAWAL